MKPLPRPWNLFIKISSPSISSFLQISSIASESKGLWWFSGRPWPWQDHLRPCLGAVCLARPRLLQKVWKELRISWKFEYATNSQDTEATDRRTHTEPVAYTENYSSLVSPLTVLLWERAQLFIRSSTGAIYRIIVWMWDVPNSTRVWTLGLQLMLSLGRL